MLSNCYKLELAFWSSFLFEDGSSINNSKLSKICVLISRRWT